MGMGMGQGKGNTKAPWLMGSSILLRRGLIAEWKSPGTGSARTKDPLSSLVFSDKRPVIRSESS
jgi:hypothetical protein